MAELAHDIPAIWMRIEDVLRRNVPGVLRSLAPPATQPAIAALESQLGLLLPADLRASLQIHDGQRARRRTYKNRIPYSYGFFLGTVDIARTHKELNEVCRNLPRTWPWRDTAENLEWWNPGWIPICDHYGSHVCVDTHCGSEVLHYPRHVMEPDKRAVAPGYGAWLEILARKLEAHNFTADKDFDTLGDKLLTVAVVGALSPLAVPLWLGQGVLIRSQVFWHLRGTVEEAWQRCAQLWSRSARVYGKHIGPYGDTPFEYILADQFVRKHRRARSFLLGQLHNTNPCLAAYAFKCLTRTKSFSLQDMPLEVLARTEPIDASLFGCCGESMILGKYFSDYFEAEAFHRATRGRTPGPIGSY